MLANFYVYAVRRESTARVLRFGTWHRYLVLVKGAVGGGFRSIVVVHARVGCDIDFGSDYTLKWILVEGVEDTTQFMPVTPDFGTGHRVYDESKEKSDPGGVELVERVSIEVI